MRTLLGILAFLCALTAHADETARARLEAFSGQLKSVSANFEQTVTDANGHRGDGSSGTFALKAPRQFRWETTQPYQQTIVADGQHVYVYEPDLQQVTVRNQSTEEAHSPLTVLTDLSQLDRQFIVSENGERDELAWLKLVSKAQDPDFEYAELGFDANSLQRMRFKDQLGNVTEIRFGAWQRNPSLPVSTFAFVPPKGVDVIGDTKRGADVYPIKD